MLEGTSGLSVVLLSGVHGNETAGVEAAVEVVDTLRKRGFQFEGSVYAVVANLAAVASGRRYVDEDLNRLWTPSTLTRVRSSPKSVEEHQMKTLLELFDHLEEVSREVVFVDLHSTSAHGAPFGATTMWDARAIPTEYLRPVELPPGLPDVAEVTEAGEAGPFATWWNSSPSS